MELVLLQPGSWIGLIYLSLSRFIYIDIYGRYSLTVIAATVRIALVDILDLFEVDIPAGGFLYPAVGWG